MLQLMLCLIFSEPQCYHGKHVEINTMKRCRIFRFNPLLRYLTSDAIECKLEGINHISNDLRDVVEPM